MKNYGNIRYRIIHLQKYKVALESKILLYYLLLNHKRLYVNKHRPTLIKVTTKRIRYDLKIDIKQPALSFNNLEQKGYILIVQKHLRKTRGVSCHRYYMILTLKFEKLYKELTDIHGEEWIRKELNRLIEEWKEITNKINEVTLLGYL